MAEHEATTMTLTAWLQERFWAGFALFAGRAGVSDMVDEFIADKLHDALLTEVAKAAAEATAAGEGA